MIRTYLCDRCDGYGTTNGDTRHPHDPARDEDMDCLWCNSTGVITADADTADLRSLQPWTGSVGRAAERIRGAWVDPLHELALARSINPKSWAYAHARQRAMQRVHRLASTDFRAGCQIIVNDVRRTREMLRAAA